MENKRKLILIFSIIIGILLLAIFLLIHAIRQEAISFICYYSGNSVEGEISWKGNLTLNESGVFREGLHGLDNRQILSSFDSCIIKYEKRKER